MTTLALLTALSLTPPLAGAPERAAAPVEPRADDDRRVALRIRSEALLEEQIAEAAEDTTFFVRTDATTALQQAHGVRVVEDASAPAIVVHLAWESYADSIYRVRLEAVRPGEPPVVVDTFTCECADSELTAAIVSRLPAALDGLEPEPAIVAEPPPPPAPPPAVEPSPRQPTVDPFDAPAMAPSRRPLGTLGRAGIVVAAVGAGTLIGGGVVFAQGRRPDPTSGRLEQREGRNFEPPGIALMATGGAAMVTGAVLLVVDRARARRRPRSALVLPSPGGLVVMGRF